MSKEEQFEHIENKIKQAITDEQPAFDEKAWVKMEALLDKEEKKRRPFLWLWFLLPLLLAGAGSVLYFTNHKSVDQNFDKNISNITDSKKNIPGASDKKELKEQTTVENIQPEKNISSLKESETDVQDVQLKEENKIVARKKRNFASKKIKVIVNAPGITDVENTINNDQEKINITAKTKSAIESPENNTVKVPETNGQKIEEKKQIADKNQSPIDSVSVAVSNKKNIDTAKPVSKKQIKQTTKKSSSFYFLAAAGADIGSVKLFSFKNSSMSAKYGLGIGYQLNKKWSVQTGFYAGKKKYAAGPGDYHPKEHSYWSYVEITKVNADCIIYEIPVTLRYNFIQKPTTSYYVTTGVSSYLMKKENYDYYYKRYNIPQQSYYSYTGNKHLFSTLSFSAGIEKKISNVFSLQLEPSVSLPLSGVGDGSVKLFSTALMIGLKYVPFKK